MKTVTYIHSLLGVLVCAGAVGAADYPVKPVRVVVGFPAGSGVDIVHVPYKGGPQATTDLIRPCLAGFHTRRF
jgi:tripartite-type tricarboxylate transporter receptor subunit TctC